MFRRPGRVPEIRIDENANRRIDWRVVSRRLREQSLLEASEWKQTVLNEVPGELHGYRNRNCTVRSMHLHRDPYNGGKNNTNISEHFRRSAGVQSSLLRERVGATHLVERPRILQTALPNLVHRLLRFRLISTIGMCLN